MHKIGLVIPTFNRSEYLKQTLDSIKASDLTKLDLIYIIDDASTDHATLDLINDFNIDGITIIKKYNEKNTGMYNSLLFGFDYLFNNGFTDMCNLDSDVLLKYNWLDTLLNLSNIYNKQIITGFNTVTSGRHAILKTYPTYHTKSTIGGINLFFKWESYLDKVRPSFLKGNSWDWQMCDINKKLRMQFIVTNPSVIQHIGMNSSDGLNHIGADVALDF